MKVLSLGSLNIDKVYSVNHFVTDGETISSEKTETFSGGKGLNQSIALAKAGAAVYHAGAIGNDGEFLQKQLEEAGVNTEYLVTTDGMTGHAIIQLNPKGKNCIIISAGANGMISQSYIDTVLGGFNEGDILLLQNEISNVGYAMKRAKEYGLKVVFNASPVNEALNEYPLELVDCFIVNEIEGKYLAGIRSGEADKNTILAEMSEKFPEADVVLTLGEDGVMYKSRKEILEHGIFKTDVVDTTAAGDTFCGYFIAGIAEGRDTAECLKTASAASAIAISKKGAAVSIPEYREVRDFLKATAE